MWWLYLTFVWEQFYVACYVTQNLCFWALFCVHLGGQNAKWRKASSNQETQDASDCFNAFTQVSLDNDTHIYLIPLVYKKEEANIII